MVEASQALPYAITPQVGVGVAVAVLAVVAGAAYVFLVKKAKPVLHEVEYRAFPIVRRTQLSHNVLKFRCALPSPNAVLGLPVGQHIRITGFDKEGAEVVKPYTPTTLDSDKGYFELVVKIYPEGKMSYHLSTLKVGDAIHARGPSGRFSYKPNQYRACGMLAGGTGITPMFQVARAILENPKDNTKVHLLYANVTYDDILLKEELDSLANNYRDKFTVYYVLNNAPEKWTGGVGFISSDMIKKHCPSPAADIKILRCGPPGMNKAMQDHLNALGYSKDMQFQF